MIAQCELAYLEKLTGYDLSDRTEHEYDLIETCIKEHMYLSDAALHIERLLKQCP